MVTPYYIINIIKFSLYLFILLYIQRLIIRYAVYPIKYIVTYSLAFDPLSNSKIIKFITVPTIAILYGRTILNSNQFLRPSLISPCTKTITMRVCTYNLYFVHKTTFYYRRFYDYNILFCGKMLILLLLLLLLSLVILILCVFIHLLTCPCI